MSLSPTYGPCAPASESHARRHGIVALVGEFLDERVFAPLATYRARAQLRDELAGLDHRELKDIGISDLESFVAGWRPGQRG